MCYPFIYIYIYAWVHKTGFPRQNRFGRPRTPDSAREIQIRQQFYQPIAVAATHGESQSLWTFGVLKVIFAYYGKLTNKA